MRLLPLRLQSTRGQLLRPQSLRTQPQPLQPSQRQSMHPNSPSLSAIGLHHRLRRPSFVMLSVLSLSLLILAGCSGGDDVPAAKAAKPQVMVLGIDGATWDVMKPLIDAGELPNLAKLYARGIHGVLQSRPPALSPVVWTTMFTGRPWQEHGVRDWKTSQSQHRKVAAVWEMSSARGLVTDVFNVPGSWPPVPVNGVMFSGFPISGSTVGGNTGFVLEKRNIDSGKLASLHRGNLEAIRREAARLEPGQWSPWFEATMPNRASLTGIMRIKRLREGGKFYISPFYRTDDGLEVTYPAALRKNVREKLSAPYIPEGPGWSKYAEEDTPEYLAEHLAQVFELQGEAAKLYAPEDWDLFIYVMTLVDRVSHPYWAYAFPDGYKDLDAAKAARYSGAVAQSYRKSDAQLGELLAAAGGDPYVIIVSDHGFQQPRDMTKHVGAHHFDGVYLVAGPKLHGSDGGRRFIEDVGPTILYLLGMPVAQDMAGKVVPEVVAQVGREPATIASYERNGRESTEEPVDESTWEQLKGLGYVEGDAPRKAGKPGATKPALNKPALNKPAVNKPPVNKLPVKKQALPGQR